MFKEIVAAVVVAEVVAAVAVVCCFEKGRTEFP